jgi:unsaturated rhamnogalacturonyl hydrolase
MYAARFNQPADFDDIAWQFLLMEQVARDDETGLLYHGWDESRKQTWSDPQTGCSPNFWGRAMGWYGMALVDVLDFFPEGHPQREDILAVLQRFAQAVISVQDANSHLWWQVLDKPGRAGNYLEASASCMFIYALAKGARKGWLPAKARQAAQRGWQAALREFIREDAEGRVWLEKTCGVAGLGGNPYRDGSYAYYTGEKQVTNDPKGVGAYLLAGVEMELA